MQRIRQKVSFVKVFSFSLMIQSGWYGLPAIHNRCKKAQKQFSLLLPIFGTVSKTLTSELADWKRVQVCNKHLCNQHFNTFQLTMSPCKNGNMFFMIYKTPLIHAGMLTSALWSAGMSCQKIIIIESYNKAFNSSMGFLLFDKH